MKYLIALSLVVCLRTIALNAKMTLAACSTSCPTAHNAIRTCPASDVCVVDRMVSLKNDPSGTNFTVKKSEWKRCSKGFANETIINQTLVPEDMTLKLFENETKLYHTYQFSDCTGNKSSMSRNLSFISEMESKGWKFNDPLARPGSFVDCPSGSNQCEYFLPGVNESQFFLLVCQSDPCRKTKNRTEYGRVLGTFMSFFDKIGLAVPPSEVTVNATQEYESNRSTTTITSEATFKISATTESESHKITKSGETVSTSPTWSNQKDQATSFWKGITTSVQAEDADAYVDGNEDSEDLHADRDLDTKSHVTTGTTQVLYDEDDRTPNAIQENATQIVDTSPVSPLPVSPSKRFAWEWVVVGICIFIVLKIAVLLLCLHCIRKRKEPKKKVTEKAEQEPFPKADPEPQPEPLPVEPAENSSEFDSEIGEPGIDKSAMIDAEERDLCIQTDETSSKNSDLLELFDLEDSLDIHKKHYPTNKTNKEKQAHTEECVN